MTFSFTVRRHCIYCPMAGNIPFTPITMVRIFNRIERQTRLFTNRIAASEEATCIPWKNYGKLWIDKRTKPVKSFTATLTLVEQFQNEIVHGIGQSETLPRHPIITG